MELLTQYWTDSRRLTGWCFALGRQDGLTVFGADAVDTLLQRCSSVALQPARDSCLTPRHQSLWMVDAHDFRGESPKRYWPNLVPVVVLQSRCLEQRIDAAADALAGTPAELAEVNCDLHALTSARCPQKLPPLKGRVERPLAHQPTAAQDAATGDRRRVT